MFDTKTAISSEFRCSKRQGAGLETKLGILLAASLVVGVLPADVRAQSSGMLSAQQISSDTGTVIVEGLADKGGQVFNVKAYGAKGDRTADDTAAIDSALTAAAPVHGAVLFVPGTYKVSTLNIPSGVTLLCSAWLACTLLYSKSQTIGANGGLANYFTASINGIVFDFGNTSNGLIFNDVLNSNSSFQVQNTTGTALTIKGTCSTPGRPSTCTNNPWPSSSSAFNTFPYIGLKNVGVGLVLNGDDNKAACGGPQIIGGAVFFNHFGTLDILGVTGAEAVEFTSGTDSNTFQNVYFNFKGSNTGGNGIVMGSRCPESSGGIDLNHFNYVSADAPKGWTGYQLVLNYGVGTVDHLVASGSQSHSVLNNGHGIYSINYNDYAPIPGISGALNQQLVNPFVFTPGGAKASPRANQSSQPISLCGSEWNGSGPQTACYHLSMKTGPGYDALGITPDHSVTANNAVSVPKLVVQQADGNFSFVYAGSGKNTQFLAQTSNMPGRVNIAEFGGGGAGSISSGKITLSAGSGSHTFVTPYLTAPVCVVTDNTSREAVNVASTTTAISVTGSRSDVVSWICMPAAN